MCYLKPKLTFAAFAFKGAGGVIVYLAEKHIVLFHL